VANRPGHVHDEFYPAYTIGTAADLIGTTPAFLRALGDAGLITPQRSSGGHRRYSRHQLDLAARARELLDEGLPLTAACRIVRLEDELADVRRQLADLGGAIPPPRSPQD
jgi:MerR family transcriptional regulator, heat shock protein HspR